MAMPKDDIYKPMVEGWKDFMVSLEKSLELLEQDIDETVKMADQCTAEWCQATEHVIDELSNALFSISEPRWSSEADSQKIKELKKRVHDAYAKYKSAAS
jgi:hypothetical protein